MSVSLNAHHVWLSATPMESNVGVESNDYTDGAWPGGARPALVTGRIHRRTRDVKLLRTLIVLLIPTWVMGCGDAPGTEAGRAALEDLINQHSEGRLELVDYQETGREVVEAATQTQYKLDFAARLRALESGYWTDSEWPDAHGILATVSTKPDIAADENRSHWYAMEEGEEFAVHGRVRLRVKQDGETTTLVTVIPGEGS